MTEKPLVPAFVLEQGMINPCLTRGADYEVYTESLRVDDNAEPGRHILSMVGSSTITDLQEDRMKLSALDDMTKVPDGLLCYLNHQYQVPEDILGSLYGKPYVISSKGIADLHLMADVEMDNPRAAQAYNMIAKRKRRLGCSVGCQVTSFEIDPQTGGIVISHVTVLEWSLVSIPANQRCWVEVATKSLFERALLEGRGDDALNLASAVKGMYWRSYDNLVKHIESPGLKHDLERVTPRETAPHRIMTAFNDGRLNFALADNKGITKSLSRDEVSALLQKGEDRYIGHILTQDSKVDEAMDLNQKSVSGKTDLPLMDIETEWTGSKAEKQIFEYARDDNDEIVASKAKQCFLYFDPENTNKQSGYKMPFCYVEGGTPKIVPLGIRAAANVLVGGMSGISASAEDKAGMMGKCKTLYGRINSQFKPDPAWVVPWEKDGDKEKSAEVETTKDILDTDNGKDLIRQDLKEDTEDNKMTKKEMPKASEVTCSADGSHAACTGTHTHAHKAYGDQGDDDLHEHEHSHDEDANHGHSHETQKSVDDAPIVEKQVEVAQEPEASEEVVEVTKVAEVTDPAVVAEDPLRLALLTAYNAVGKQLGFEPASLEQKCAMGDMNMQTAIGLISQVDACIDQADNYVDQLMALYSIPDVDKMPDGDDTPLALPMTSYSAEASLLKLFDTFLQKEGKELNEKNRGLISLMHDHAKSVHDLAAAMHPDCCKCDGMSGSGTDFESARQDAQVQMGQIADGLTRSMDLLAQALQKFSIGNLEQNFNRMKSEESALHKELANLKSNINALKNMPLGRPTQLNRSVEGEATYDDMRMAAGQHVTLAEVLKGTKKVEINKSSYRYWPANVGVGIRPTLTNDQKSLMTANDILSYQDGGAAHVPMLIDDEA